MFLLLWKIGIVMKDWLVGGGLQLEGRFANIHGKGSDSSDIFSILSIYILIAIN